MIQEIRVYRIDNKIDLKPVAQRLTSFFEAQAKQDENAPEATVSVKQKPHTNGFYGQQLIVAFSKPVELNRDVIRPVESALGSVLGGRNITINALLAPESSLG
jgi:hypothetical protein